MDQIDFEQERVKILDNITNTVKDDLQKTIHKDGKVSISADCFSIYVYKELKKCLDEIEELRFIFTSPTFIAEKIEKTKREFYIPRTARERNLYGTEFEVKLRNEMTQKSIAKECANWIRKKVIFKSNTTNQAMQKFINVENQEKKYTYMPINDFTTVDIGCERGNSLSNIVTRLSEPDNNYYVEAFNSIWKNKDKLQDVTEEVIENITAVYKENSAEYIYFLILYNIFNEFLNDITEDILPDEALGFKESAIWNKLYNFQKDAALAIITKLEKYNGCILADSVGLGKTFTALSVIKYYEKRNKDVLVLCPKKLGDNWNTFNGKYLNNPLKADRFGYTVLYHTDLGRKTGKSNGIDLGRIDWANFGLVVIDESHNFRNGGKPKTEENEKENRYIKLMNEVIKAGIQTKVLMLSATPVNNKFNDLKNQIALAYEGDHKKIDHKLSTTHSINEIFKNAQKVFNKWIILPVEKRTTEELQKMLDFDFFEVLDSVTIARSRKQIEKYYDTTEVGKFPKRNTPISLRPHLTDLDDAIGYNEIFEHLMNLNLAIYTPIAYLHPSKSKKYLNQISEHDMNFVIGRELGIKKLTAINLMKRMESSVYSFKLTLQRMRKLMTDTISKIENYERNYKNIELTLEDISMVSENEYDYDDQNMDFTVGKTIKINLEDMDYLQWKNSLVCDAEILELLTLMVDDITPTHDSKLQALLSAIEEKIALPINSNNRKIIVFTAFADTANYLYDNIAKYIKNKYQLNTAMITGSIDGKSTIPKLKSDLNTVLTCFSPISKEKDLIMPELKEEIDILIATDCISEGQNLQDCDYLVNYDIHWNPVRIIQRFGRIDRIGSKNNVIQLVNFWPDITLDEYINLKARVETKMKIVTMVGTGDNNENVLSNEEKEDLEYRRKQLEKLQSEVVDLEDIVGGISIMDLGLNEFRMDLLAYMQDNPNIEKAPYGLHAITKGEKSGIIFVLKNINPSVNIEDKNRLHPFYMVYISEDGTIHSNHYEAKNTLDIMRLFCKDKSEPDPLLCKDFNQKTSNGKNMKEVSNLLKDTINSIIKIKEEKELDGFFSGEIVSFINKNIKGIDDFELIAFIVVEGEKND